MIAWLRAIFKRKRKRTIEEQSQEIQKLTSDMTSQMNAAVQALNKPQRSSNDKRKREQKGR